MLILSGYASGEIELVDVTEQEFSELPRISTLGMNKHVYNSLLRIFTDNPNLLLCSVWLTFHIEEILDKNDLIKISGDNAFAIQEALAPYSDETYFVHSSLINLNHLNSFTLHIAPLRKMALPKESLIQFRKALIEKFLKEL